MDIDTNLELVHDSSASRSRHFTNTARSSRDVRSFSLIQLAGYVCHGCYTSLKELHKRRFLPGPSKRKKRTIVEYIAALAETGKDRYELSSELINNIEYAQNLTTDKFSRLPIAGMKRKEVDCRYYIKAFLNKMAQFIKKNYGISHLELERESIRVLEGLIKRHYFLSLKEAFRSNNLYSSRYNWKLPGGTICVKMPITITGRDRGKWLALHVGDPDPLRPGEKKRIQEIIDQYFGVGNAIRFDDRINYSHAQEPSVYLEESNKFDLGKVVAVEKVNLIDQQRPSIKKLGPHLLRELIQTIFSCLEEGCFEDAHIAAEFGLSKSTFSRFAGSNWLKTENGIPDLWRNTATVIMANPEMRKAFNVTAIQEIVNQRT